MTISHLWQKNQGGSFYYKRRYPKAVCEILGVSRSAIKAICLNTTDAKSAAKLALKYAAHDDAEWSRLVRGEVNATRKVTAEYLESFGVSPTNPQSTPDNTDLLIDHIRTFISEDDEQRIYDDEIDDPASVLPPLQAAALRMAQGLFMASDALAFYLEMSGEGKAKTFAKIPKIAFAKLIESCGDKPVTSYRRADVRKLIEDMRKSGNSTSTVRRQLNSLVAAFSLVIRERELVYTNPFIKAVIPGEGLDALAAIPRSNFAAMTEPDKAAELLRSIHSYSGHPYAVAALKISPLVFVRTGELRGATMLNGEYRLAK